jgi:hypothetical protein
VVVAVVHIFLSNSYNDNSLKRCCMVFLFCFCRKATLSSQFLCFDILFNCWFRSIPNPGLHNEKEKRAETKQVSLWLTEFKMKIELGVMGGEIFGRDVLHTEK